MRTVASVGCLLKHVVQIVKLQETIVRWYVLVNVASEASFRFANFFLNYLVIWYILEFDFVFPSA